MVASLPLPAAAQSLTWTDIECRESRLAVPENFRCRTTDPYRPGANAHASYRFQIATMIGKDGITYFYLMEGLDARSWIRLSRALPEQLSQSIPLAQAGHGWSAVRLHAGSGYALFTAETGQRCVGFRKPGPDRGAGYAWAILGVHCAAQGQPLADNDIASVIESARPR